MTLLTAALDTFSKELKEKATESTEVFKLYLDKISAFEKTLPEDYQIKDIRVEKRLPTEIDSITVCLANETLSETETLEALFYQPVSNRDKIIEVIYFIERTSMHVFYFFKDFLEFLSMRKVYSESLTGEEKEGSV